MVEFSKHIGGMTTSGISVTDIGNKSTIGGLARDFYRRVGKHYEKKESFTFEPHIASKVFEEWLQKYHIKLYLEHQLDRVVKKNGAIHEIKMKNGRTFKAKIFIDATYEGDLMTKAGVSFTVGREDNSIYNEKFNGIHFQNTHHSFKKPIDPYFEAGKPRSGLLPGISTLSQGVSGQGDTLIQAYNFRLCLTRNAKKLCPFTKPREYNPQRYLLLSRYINSGIFDIFGFTRKIPDNKYDFNSWGAVSPDNIGTNYNWPDADYMQREYIFQDHLSFQMGFFWYLSTDSSIPSAIRKKSQEWGLASDEFENTGNWPPLLYIRESRRMISDYVVTEHDAFEPRNLKDPVALASYRLDSHICKRIVKNGIVVNEGDVEAKPKRPFQLPYRIIRPKRDECKNLLVPAAISASHIAYGAIRTEPVFMMTGQAAGAAASLAIYKNNVVQDISYSDLEKSLRNYGQVLEYSRFGLFSL